jgi:hypothetical protein
MAAAAHSNVGLFHATMAVFNAWCDRMPLLLIGATGPLDAAHRRPWIEWIHTARDQGAIVRSYTKWDDQPASPAAAREAILRAVWMAESTPKAPVYVNLDVGLQEAPLEHPLPADSARRYMPDASTGASAEQIEKLAALVVRAQRPVFLAGRVSRSKDAWDARVELAEAVGARVVTDLKVGAAFPTDHPIACRRAGDLCSAGRAESDRRRRRHRELRLGGPRGNARRRVRQKGTRRDRRADLAGSPAAQRLEHGPSGLAGRGFPDRRRFRSRRAGALARDRQADRPSSVPVAAPTKPAPVRPALVRGPVTMAHLAAGLREALGARDVSLTHLPLGWDGALWDFAHPLDFLGSDGGGGIGGGPGISVGAALALQGSGRLPICIGGDGDFLMGATAIWTAAHYRIPLLVIVANNQSFFNDEVHQERVARMRGRPVENKWIGQRIADPGDRPRGTRPCTRRARIGPVTAPMGSSPRSARRSPTSTRAALPLST